MVIEPVFLYVVHSQTLSPFTEALKTVLWLIVL